MLSLCITPFGSPVVPEVKGRYITWLASPLGVDFERRSGQIAERRRVGGPTAPGAAQEIAVGELGEDVVPVGIGAVAGLRDQRGGAHAVDQRDDLGQPCGRDASDGQQT